MQPRGRVAIWLVVLLLMAAVACGTDEQSSTPEPVVAGEEAPGEGEGVAPAKLPDQLFAAHYVDSYPNHGDVFAQVPARAHIDFNFTLHEASSITVTRDGAPVEVGTLNLGLRNLSMWVALSGGAGDGLYLVKYSACWPDRSCHQGQFAFTVDAKTSASYLDLTGKQEVPIDMRDIKFEPAAVVVSPGTRITWRNRDPVTHFVNTDPHPSHNVVPELNSLDLGQGQSYSFTFNQPGEWGYHCSAHFPSGMTARVIVQP